MPAPSARDLIDLVDDNDRVIGHIHRGDALREHAGFRVAHVIVYDHDGRILLQRLPTTRDRSGGRWGSSVAGYLHAGEEPREGAQRRMREEIDLTTPLKFCGRARMNDDGATKFIYVYATRSDHADINDVTHIAELKFWEPGTLHETLEKEPDAFTATLPHVLATATPPDATA